MYIWTFSVVALKYVVYIPRKLRHGSASQINVEKYILCAKYDHLLMNFVGFSTSKPPERLNKMILSGSGRKGCWSQELLKVSLELCLSRGLEEMRFAGRYTKYLLLEQVMHCTWKKWMRFGSCCVFKYRPNLKKKEKKIDRKC